MIEAFDFSEGYETEEALGRIVTSSRSVYDTLISALGAAGTEVMRDRVLERDKDIYPYRFVRKGTMEFVYPPQETTVQEDRSGVIDPNPNYSLDAESVVYAYDPSQVTAHVRVEYSDANRFYKLRVTPVEGKTAFPEEFSTAIDTAAKAILRIRKPEPPTLPATDTPLLLE